MDLNMFSLWHLIAPMTVFKNWLLCFFDKIRKTVFDSFFAMILCSWIILYLHFLRQPWPFFLVGMACGDHKTELEVCIGSGVVIVSCLFSEWTYRLMSLLILFSKFMTVILHILHFWYVCVFYTEKPGFQWHWEQ